MHPQRKSYMVIHGRNYGPVYNTHPLYLEAHFREKSACYIRSFTVVAEESMRPSEQFLRMAPGEPRILHQLSRQPANPDDYHKNDH